MKKLSWIDRLLFAINSLLATALLLSYLLPYIPPSRFPLISIMSLAVPLLILINILFALYWLIKLKRQFFLSTFILLIGFQYVNSYFQLSDKKVLLSNDIKIMSYNVRLFNLHKWKKLNSTNMTSDFSKFVIKTDPDILCFQEYLTAIPNDPFEFPYKYIYKNEELKNSYFGQAIFSKYKIINSGSLNFDNSFNNTIFVDIVKDKDTLRVYNIHLESQKIKIDEENFGQGDSEKLVKRLQNTFKIQEEQVKKIISHEEKSNYKVIMCGDFNNTAFSWTYKKLKNNKQDAFVKAGKNLGRTYDYPFPVRIDFILADNEYTINHFKTYPDKFSDHFPIMARINREK